MTAFVGIRWVLICTLVTSVISIRQSSAAPDCTESALRETVQKAGTVELRNNCTYTLLSDLPTLESELDLNGNGSVIDGNEFRIFSAPGNHNIALRNLTIRN